MGLFDKRLNTSHSFYNMKKLQSYTLYDTFAVNIEDKPLPSKKINEFVTCINNMSDMQKEAFVLLIMEHAIRYEDYKISPRKISLPYEITCDKEKAVVDLDKIPNKLKWILYKFCTKIISN